MIRRVFILSGSVQLELELFGAFLNTMWFGPTFFKKKTAIIYVAKDASSSGYFTRALENSLINAWHGIDKTNTPN